MRINDILTENNLKWTKDDIDLLKSLVLNPANFTYTQIGSKLNRTSTSIEKAVKRFFSPEEKARREDIVGNVKWTSDEINQLKNYALQDGLTTEEIADRWNKSPLTIISALYKFLNPTERVQREIILWSRGVKGVRAPKTLQNDIRTYALEKGLTDQEIAEKLKVPETKVFSWISKNFTDSEKTHRANLLFDRNVQGRKYSEKMKGLIRDYVLKDNLSDKEIADLLHTSESSIASWINKNFDKDALYLRKQKLRDRGIRVHIPISKEDGNDIRKWYAQGKNPSEIGPKLNPQRDPTTIQGWLENQTDYPQLHQQFLDNGGYTKKFTPSPKIARDIRKWFSAGLSYVNISRKITPPRSKDIIKKWIENQDDFALLRQEHLDHGGILHLQFSPVVGKKIRDKFAQGMGPTAIGRSLTPERDAGSIRGWLGAQDDWPSLYQKYIDNGGLSLVRISPEEGKKIRDKFAQGMGPTAIGRSLEPIRDTSTVAAWLERQEDYDDLLKLYQDNGGRILPQRLTNEQIQDIRKLYIQGHGSTEIGYTLGRDPSTVLGCLKRQTDYDSLKIQHLENRQSVTGTSYEEIYFFNSLEKNGIRLSKRNYRLGLEGRRYYNLDGVDFDNKVVVEYFGDRWHANPKVSQFGSAPDTPNVLLHNLTPREIWEYDQEKIKYLESLGYIVIVVWGSDWKKKSNQPAIIDRIKKTITSRRAVT